MTINWETDRPIPNGVRVTIVAPDSFHDGGWGIVRHFDGDDYHVAMYAGDTDQCIFKQSELRVVPSPKK